MTTYVGNGFSPNMIKDSAVVEIEATTRQAFCKACKGGRSIIGHPEIAEKFNVPMNRKNITLECGDTLYVVSPRQRLKTEEYEYVSDESQYIYKKIHVIRQGRKHYD